MARVNVESSAINSVAAINRLLGCDPGPMFHLVCLWQTSQDLGVCEGTEEQIKSWAQMVGDQSSSLLDKLVLFGFLERNETRKTLMICGNEKHIQILKNFKAGRQLGGKIRAKYAKRDEKGRLLQQGAGEPSSAIQYNTIHITTPTPSKGSGSGIDPKALAELWNVKADPSLPRVKDLDRSQKRYRMAEQRLKSKPDLSYWASVIERINRKPFFKGDNDRGWKASFEYLVRPDTHAKLMEEAASEPKTTGRKLLFGAES
jgi:hypothetical protein